MNISFVIKSLVLSLFVIMIIFAISFISSQKYILDSNNYGIKDSVKESINIAEYRKSGEIVFDQDLLIKSVLKNYIENNNLKVDEVTFEIALDEEENIVTVKIYTDKNVIGAVSEASYTFSYQVVER